MTGRRSHGRLSALNGVVHQGSLTPEGQTGTATVIVIFEGGRSTQSASVDVEITAVPVAMAAR